MKPQNVIEHEHYYAYDPEVDDLIGRYDACLTKDDGAGVWSPASGTWWPMKDYETAKRTAEHMAVLYAQYHPID